MSRAGKRSGIWLALSARRAWRRDGGQQCLRPGSIGEAVQDIYQHRLGQLASAGDALEELLELRQHILQLCPHPVINGTFGLLESNGESESRGQAQGSAAHQDKLGLGADWSSAVEEECQESLRIIDHVTKVEKWTLVDSIYFTMTAVTTIGYGHISPATRYGRLFCVLYSLVGVPLTCILMAYSSEMLSNRMLQLYTSARKRHQRHRKTLLYGITWIYLSVGFIVFMFLPSLALSKLEDWSYEDALYYTFITLSTIGFGDLVAGYRKDQPYSEVYKLAIVVWIMMALGYWFLLLNFLQKALKSNVPRRIKKTFRSKRIAKQAEFFRQLVGRVKLGQRKASLVDGDRGVVALMVEVAGAFVGDEPGRTSRKQSLRIDCTQGNDDSDSEANEPLTLSDLLDVNVVLRSDSMPAIRNLAVENFPDEVVLPLREVLHLVSLVASVEEQVHNTCADDDATACSSTTLQEDPTDSTPSIVTFDPRENVPLLRDIFHYKHNHHAKSAFCNGIKMKSRMRTLSQREEEEIDEVLNEVFDAGRRAQDTAGRRGWQLLHARQDRLRAQEVGAAAAREEESPQDATRAAGRRATLKQPFWPRTGAPRSLSRRDAQDFHAASTSPSRASMSASLMDIFINGFLRVRPRHAFFFSQASRREGGRPRRSWTPVIACHVSFCRCIPCALICICQRI
ncbi:hypothetical protein C7M84_021422 [Penaeus vannamei]|uniref:Potassium channel domain-containing protein n=1 Tax=Penaeus vannamei TaxID=6689 RepID=A0A3R7PFA5_PENVA|nr:hypothetical protein C7M84_021422 [Penaeus vannamei]